MSAIYEVRSGEGLVLSIYDNYLSIKPKGFLGFTRYGFSGERILYYKNITSIQFQKSTFISSGFIEFYCLGYNNQDQGGNITTGANNMNRFTFNNKNLEVMKEIYSYIQNKLK